MKYLIMLIAVGLVGCSVYSPDAGHEVVLIEKPWIFGHGGVDPEAVRAGMTITAVTTDGIDVSMQPMKFDTELPDTMTSDGVPISFHAITVLQVTDSVSLIKNFGPEWYKNNLEEQFKTMVRQAVRKHGMNETAISTTALDAIDSEIRVANTLGSRGDGSIHASHCWFWCSGRHRGWGGSVPDVQSRDSRANNAQLSQHRQRSLVSIPPG